MMRYSEFLTRGVPEIRTPAVRVSDLGRSVPQQHLEGIGALKRLPARLLLGVIGSWGTFSRLAAGGLPLCSLRCFVSSCLL